MFSLFIFHLCEPVRRMSITAFSFCAHTNIHSVSGYPATESKQDGTGAAGNSAGRTGCLLFPETFSRAKINVLKTLLDKLEPVLLKTGLLLHLL